MASEPLRAVGGDLGAHHLGLIAADGGNQRHGAGDAAAGHVAKRQVCGLCGDVPAGDVEGGARVAVAFECLGHAVPEAVMPARVHAEDGRGQEAQRGAGAVRVGRDVGGPEGGAFAPALVPCVGGQPHDRGVVAVVFAPAGQAVGAAAHGQVGPEYVDMRDLHLVNPGASPSPSPRHITKVSTGEVVVVMA